MCFGMQSSAPIDTLGFRSENGIMAEEGTLRVLAVMTWRQTAQRLAAFFIVQPRDEAWVLSPRSGHCFQRISHNYFPHKLKFRAKHASVDLCRLTRALYRARRHH